MMDINLLTAVKRRVMYELRSSINEHYNFKGTEVYHKFPYTERPERGVVLRNTSSSRIKLSPDDFAYTMKSYVSLARAENHPGRFMQWVWENREKTSAEAADEDLSSQITGTATNGTNRFFYTTHKPILAGYNNDDVADNFRQVELKLNGETVHADFVDGSRGMIVLSMAPVVGDTLTVTYYYGIFSAPGRYYIEIVDSGHYVIDPLLQIKKEEVIEITTGTELTANLDHTGLHGDFDLLYLMRGVSDEKYYLVKGTDYTLDTDGLITFLQPLSVGYTLFADYRYVVPTMGPFVIPDPLHYDADALPGVVFCFNKQIEVGDKVVVIVYPDRQLSASVYMGHYNMVFDIEVFSRHPEESAEMADHLIHEIWGNRRYLLVDEGLTIEEFDQTGESEEIYDTNTNDYYYKQSLSLQMMTEWKKFVPMLWDIEDYDVKLYAYLKTTKYLVTPDNKVFELQINPLTDPFEVKYPKTGYPKYV
jgi:hypothetical protein